MMCVHTVWLCAESYELIDEGEALLIGKSLDTA